MCVKKATMYCSKKKATRLFKVDIDLCCHIYPDIAINFLSFVLKNRRGKPLLINILKMKRKIFAQIPKEIKRKIEDKFLE